MKNIFILLLTLVLINQVHAQVQLLPTRDGSYGGGLGYTRVSDLKGSAITQAGDTTYVAGGRGGGTSILNITKLNLAGELITSFGTSGIVTIGITGTSPEVTSIAVDENTGTIYVAGTCTLATVIEGFIVSVNWNGTMNTSFSGDGQAYFNSPAGSQTFYDIKVQKDGKLVAAGDSATYPMVARFTKAGIPDVTFSGDGMYTTRVLPASMGSTLSGYSRKIDIGNNNDIYIAAENSIGTSGNYLVKVNQNGALVFSKSILGSFYNEFGGIKFTGGKILVASTYPFGTYYMKLYSYLPDGSVDTNFGGGTGAVSTSSPSYTYSDYATGLVIDKYGRIIITGYTNIGSAAPSYVHMAYRFYQNGVKDAAFKQGAITGSPSFQSNGSVITPDDRLLLVHTTQVVFGAGVIYQANVTRYDIRRFHNDNFFPTFSSPKYAGSDPFYLQAFSNPAYPVTYSSSNVSKLVIDGRKATPKDSGAVLITAVVPEDSAFYTLVEMRLLMIEANAPAFILGERLIPEGDPAIKTYSITPDNLYGQWNFIPLDSVPNVDYYDILTGPSPAGVPPTVIDIYFKREFKGGTLTYTYTDQFKKKIIIERFVDSGPLTTEVSRLDSLECSPEITSCSGVYIDDFTIGTLSNLNSACSMGGYNDYTSLPITTNLYIGEPYTAIIKIKNLTNQGRFVALWLDHNNDGDFTSEDFLGADFTDNEEVIIQTSAIRNNPELLGPKRLRVRTISNGIFSEGNACQTAGEYGETEDYIVTLTEKDVLQGPNVVTPNDDGKNDLLVIRGINGKKSNKLVIFDRLGDVKYSKENYDNNWDGKDKNGKLLSRGTYYYVFTNGEDQVRSFFELLY